MENDTIMKNKNPRGFFDETFRLEKLSKQGDPLVMLKEKINWEIFYPTIESIFAKEKKGPGGRTTIRLSDDVQNTDITKVL